jgi:hypothetical protein
MSVFKVLINEVFVNIDINNLDIVDNKHVFSLVNKFFADSFKMETDFPTRFFPLLWIVPFLQYCSKYILEIHPASICHFQNH